MKKSGEVKTMRFAKVLV